MVGSISPVDEPGTFQQSGLLHKKGRDTTIVSRGPPNCGMSEVTQKRLLLGIWKWHFYGISKAFPWLGSRWLTSPRIPRCLRFHDFDPGGAWSHFEGHGVLDRVQRIKSAMGFLDTVTRPGKHTKSYGKSSSCS